MTKVQRVLAILLLILAPPALCQAPGQVHSVDQLPGAFKSKEGLAKFREQMSGVPLPDGFGTSLPPGLGAKSIVQLVAPGKDSSLATLVGMKAWPYRTDAYIAIVCFAKDKAEYEAAKRYNAGRPSCHGPAEVHLAMLEYGTKDAAPKLIAGYGRPLDITTSWQYSKLEGPFAAECRAIVPVEYSRFDFAPFKISSTATAFGMRVGWDEGYAGGGADFQALLLFALDGARLVNVLSEPIYYSKNIAGDWHPDGTRDHFLSEGENIVTVLPHQAGGHFELQLKTLGKKWKQVFTWDHLDGRYQPRNVNTRQKAGIKSGAPGQPAGANCQGNEAQ